MWSQPQQFPKLRRKEKKGTNSQALELGISSQRGFLLTAAQGAGAGVWWRSRHSHGGSTLYMGVQLPTDTEQCDPSQDGSWQELSKAGMHMPVRLWKSRVLCSSDNKKSILIFL